MNKIILHLSDLHVFSKHDGDGNLIDINDKGVKSFLTTHKNNDFSFIDSFTDKVTEEYKGYEIYLIISGDIVDKAKKDEFELAQNILERIFIKLNINKSNILIVPGDHDVNRLDCGIAFENDNSSKKAYDFNVEKFQKFSIFYDVFFKSTNIKFDATNPCIHSILIEPENILIVGFNSNFHIGTKGGLGYFDKELLKIELKKLKQKYKKHIKIAVFHHNIVANYTENEFKIQWEKENYADTRNLFLEHNFNTFFYGNEHTSSSDEINDVNHSSVGSFSHKGTSPTFKVYEIYQDTNITSLNIKHFEFKHDYHNSSIINGNWNITKSNNERKKFILTKKNIDVVKDENSLPQKKIKTDSLSKMITQKEKKKIVVPKVSEKTKKYSKKLFEIVKNKKLFHSGHFHWSETSRAHNWIDVSKLFQNKRDLLITKKSIINLIQENNLVDKFDYIIGLGMEGNILATRTSVLFNKPYSFLPYSYRYDEHNEYEKELNLNKIEKGKSVLIITDVVHDGRTIRKLLHKREDDFFKNAKKVIVLSLFYTGEERYNEPDILNSKNITDFDTNTDHAEDRIEFYYVSHLKVEECPYSENFRSTCMIYKEKLSCVHYFYDEEKAIEKKK